MQHYEAGTGYGLTPVEPDEPNWFYIILLFAAILALILLMCFAACTPSSVAVKNVDTVIAPAADTVANGF
jgi:hypothetical protein